MTDELRDVIVEVHNAFRSKLAHGKVKDGSKNNLPQGKNIYKFVCYLIIRLYYSLCVQLKYESNQNLFLLDSKL